MSENIATADRNVSLSILILDDDMDEHFILQIALDTLEIEIDITNAFNIEQAFSHLKDTASLPDLIITDINLPGQSGLEFLCDLQEIPAYKDMAIMIYGGVISPEIERAAKECNARFTLEKTPNIRELGTIMKDTIAILLKEKAEKFL